MNTQDCIRSAKKAYSVTGNISMFFGAAIFVSSMAFPGTEAYAMSPDMIFHAKPVSDRVLGTMRGGYYSNNLYFNFGFQFDGVVNGTEYTSPTLTLQLGGSNPGLYDADGNLVSAGATGVTNTLVIGKTGAVTDQLGIPSTAITGLLNTIQNAADQAVIQTTSKLTINVFNSGINIQGIMNSVRGLRINDMLKFQSVLGTLH